MLENEKLRSIKGYIIDLDGVIWTGEKVVAGAPEAIKALRDAGKQIVFVSNNSVMSSPEALLKLRRMGIETSPNELIMAPYATAHYISKKKPRASVFVVGLASLAQELENAGLIVLDDSDDVDYVVVGNDLSLSYEKLTKALRAIIQGAKFIAVNDDGILPTEHGPCPGAGATVGAVTGMIKRGPDKVIGKPHGTLALMALERMGLHASECALIGDSLMTDILLANGQGFYSILVLSGNTTTKQLAIKGVPTPDYIVPSIADVGKLVLRKEVSL